MPKDILDDQYAHLQGFPDHVLFDIARNEAAQHDYRLKAVELLTVRKSPKVKHEDLRGLVNELEIELSGIQFEYPAPTPLGLGPLAASVTTETMFDQGGPPNIITQTREDGGWTNVPSTPVVPMKEETPPDVPTTPTEPVPAQPKRTRKPKEKSDAPSES